MFFTFFANLMSVLVDFWVFSAFRFVSEVFVRNAQARVTRGRSAAWPEWEGLRCEWKGCAWTGANQLIFRRECSGAGNDMLVTA